MENLNRQDVRDQLTPRELEILRLIAAGLTNQEIAEHLFIAFETVKWYLKQIYGKLHVANRTQAIAVAQVAGLLAGTEIHRERDGSRHNLPLQPTPFIGRTSELAQLSDHLNAPTCRLLTVVGLGGIGKTRLALEAAEACLPQFRDGVYFTALAPLFDPNLIPITIAEALSLSMAPGQPLKTQLLNYLHDKHLLLVLDNFEHLLAGVGLLPELLQTALGIKIIVTSRERLQLQSEVVFRLEGLGYTNWATPEAVAESTAAQLFLQSVRRLKPSFELTSDMFGALGSVCRSVRGMPLGLLLAASWIDTLSMAEIAEEIERSFTFLEGEWRDLPERQRSLRTVFEHSSSLLTPAERSAMRCFSVFRGGFTREAAEQVGAASLKTLMGLVNKSLLTRDTSGRFDMHELVRQYAASELDQDSNERQRVQAQHTAYYASFMEARWISIRSATMKAVADEIELDMDNVRAAWSSMVDQSQFAQLAMTARVLWYFLMVRARYEEGIDLFGQAVSTLRTLTASEACEVALGEALHNLGFFWTARGRPDKGKQFAEESLAILERHQAEEIMARAYITLCRSEWLLGDPDMKMHAQRGIAVAQNNSDSWYRGPCLFLMGLANIELGLYEEALHAGDEALEYLGKAGDSYYQGLCFSVLLGCAALRLGQYEEAKQAYLHSLPYFESIHDYFEIAQSNRDLSEVYALTNEYAAAERACQKSLRYYAKAGNPGFILSNLRSVAKIYELRGESPQAVEMLALMVTHPMTFSIDLQRAQVALSHLRTSLPSTDFAGAYERGKALNLEIVVARLLQDT